MILHFVSYFFCYLYARTAFHYLNISKDNALNSNQNHKPSAVELIDHEECN